MSEEGPTLDEFLQQGIESAKETQTRVKFILDNKDNLEQIVNFTWIRGLYEHVQHIYAIEKELLRGQKEDAEARTLLIKLLGLDPRATGQEVLDAIDDVAPLIADYRRKKKGI